MLLAIVLGLIFAVFIAYTFRDVIGQKLRSWKQKIVSTVWYKPVMCGLVALGVLGIVYLCSPTARTWVSGFFNKSDPSQITAQVEPTPEPVVDPNDPIYLSSSGRLFSPDELIDLSGFQNDLGEFTKAMHEFKGSDAQATEFLNDLMGKNIAIAAVADKMQCDYVTSVTRTRATQKDKDTLYNTWMSVLNGNLIAYQDKRELNLGDEIWHVTCNNSSKFMLRGDCGNLLSERPVYKVSPRDPTCDDEEWKDTIYCKPKPKPSPTPNPSPTPTPKPTPTPTPKPTPTPTPVPGKDPSKDPGQNPNVDKSDDSGIKPIAPPSPSNPQEQQGNNQLPTDQVAPRPQPTPVPNTPAPAPTTPPIAPSNPNDQVTEVNKNTPPPIVVTTPPPVQEGANPSGGGNNGTVAIPND